ncbi:hypothetical protein PoB_001018800 [Plakobranchus ocellatus]|uniref:Uncharacterized protein n=1 Tax=Plakobranchus ocellatus TaxID=259542 RepID=A0AAV3YMV1_9GAST|nr:hypothetical protein PoB_001018800 [Plakobranchus ocellatus]
MGPGERMCSTMAARVVRGDQTWAGCRLRTASRQYMVTSLSPPVFVFYPHFLSCSIVPSTSPSAVLYFFLFPCGVWNRIDASYCACRKRRLKQSVVHELPLSGTWATSLSLHLALSSLPTSFPALSSRLLLLLLSFTSIHRSLRCWK